MRGLDLKTVSDRMMKVKVATQGGIFSIVSAHAPQQGCEDAEMDRFTEGGILNTISAHTRPTAGM